MAELEICHTQYFSCTISDVSTGLAAKPFEKRRNKLPNHCCLTQRNHTIALTYSYSSIFA